MNLKNLHRFLSLYANCPICNSYIFTEMIITFAISNQSIYKLHVFYIRDMNDENNFKYIKYRDDNETEYDSTFDKASNSFTVSKRGDLIFAANNYNPESYIIRGNCKYDHFIIQTKGVYLHSILSDCKEIKISREEILLENYKIVNDYNTNRTTIYTDDKTPAKLNIKLTPFYNLRKNSASDIISKINSLLILA